ncbi:MAG: hypothetical protein A3J66_04490 [Candidatus Magasanikbacteria bacterium RIFCSPHIGHO2_02_FULL_47_14]|uniref:Multidrug ABC transporter substrate-binding protein n=1 Tax=Candidatus Magasanikbacteria bacterium RIFCSPHIGHO2_02_FULL_47_14 TaxID=1798680 RepID=A0A1F6M4I0_9BACT|nr:MAG: hypothetical protein A3J66_04490 [Candidatus Magasanikbacteria bacterium RIFCSPHIGHO2_02_FULL_47_14]
MNKRLLPLTLALQTFRKTKARSSLTVFGIMIGIAMVIIVLSAGNGMKSLILSEVSSFGDNWIDIEVKIPSTQKNSQENSNALARGVTITTLTQDDMEAVKDISAIHAAYAGITSQVVASRAQEKKRVTVFGVTPEYHGIDKSEVVEGDFFTDADDRSGVHVVVLGSDIRDILFGNDEAVGKTVSIDGKTYEVAGVMESLGSTAFMNMDEIIYIPLTTVQRDIMGVRHVLWIIAQMKKEANPEAVAEEIRGVIRERHNVSNPDKDDFSVTTMSEALSLVDTIFKGITGLLVALATISLIVGGVGIMNVMYVSVAERTFEVGLRKSVGATDRNILSQFLVEAVIITVIGGLFGIVIGAAISFFISLGARSQGLTWEFSISWFSVVLSVSFSTLVGLFFGLYPAKKAASLDPINALREE